MYARMCVCVRVRYESSTEQSISALNTITTDLISAPEDIRIITISQTRAQYRHYVRVKHHPFGFNIIRHRLFFDFILHVLGIII